jgi:hypothetical protein
MVTRTITEDNLGAWLIKCDPTTKYNLPAAIAAGETVVDNWSVVDNYRSRMMKPGDKVILWVSGNGKVMARGIWGVGWVTGYVQDTVYEELDPGEETFWYSEADRLAVTNDIDLDIPLFDAALSAEQIIAAGLTDLEVLEIAQMSNPSWVSKDQLARLEPLLEEWPQPMEPREEITISPRGAGFGDPLQNAVVEAAAMDAVIDYYGSEWRYKDVSTEKLGWDITFTHKQSREVYRVEVKGVSGDRPIVLLTANEVRAAEEETGWALAVVTRALSKPAVTEYTADEVLEAAEPYVYKAKLGEL